jgi:dynein heavy chain
MVQLKSFASPPVSAAVVMQGLCYVFGEDHHVKGKGSDRILEFWEYAKKSILNDRLIKRVKDFKEDRVRAIPDKNIHKLREFVKTPEFDPQKVLNASKPAYNLSLWVRAVL